MTPHLTLYAELGTHKLDQVSPAKSARLSQLGQVSSARSARLVRPPNSDSHNFFVRTSFQVFLDYLERPLSQDSIHIHVEYSG